MKISIGSLVAVMLSTGLAFADKHSEAQAKVDAAKVEVCEKAKKFLSGQNDKGKCKAEHEEAAKVTCTAASSKQVTDLQTKCITAKPAKDEKKPDATKPDDKAAPAAGGTKCRALDPKDAKNIMAEADDKSSVKCASALMDALRKKLCTAENKGKKFEYTVNHDHTIAKKPLKDRNTSLTCHTVAKP
jgi:hypothetical protein